MPPIDPVTPASASPLAATAPPYVNEEPNLEMVEQGLDLAEDDPRRATMERAAIGESHLVHAAVTPYLDLEPTSRQDPRVGCQSAPNLPLPENPP